MFGVIRLMSLWKTAVITVDSEQYCTMLQTYLAMKLQKMRQRMRTVWLQQDVAMVHTTT